MSEQKFTSIDAGFSLTADAQRNALFFAIKGSGIGFGDAISLFNKVAEVL